MIEAPLTASDGPAEDSRGASRIWGIVLIVVAAQLAIIAVGMVLFSAMGLASDGTGGCGGG